MAENSTADSPVLFRYTRNQKAMDAKSTHYHKLCEELKDGSPDVRAAEDQLTKVHCSTMDPVKYRKYVETRAAVWPILSTFYSRTMTTHATVPYKASGVSTISNGEPTPDYPVHRRLRLSAHINQQQADEQLVQSLHEKFGKDAVFVIGN
ncbi:hypothetical protein GQ54DRAFT_40123 [Martensiomyces pterosporus]|nr:hypothetical protein GQ54DRAFT_40123 [Martensiomyces pterosporus]